jgi:acetyltransferase-like isoleucine patch superfamily enzyme
MNGSIIITAAPPTRGQRPMVILAIGFEKVIYQPLSSACARLMLCLWGARGGHGLQVTGRIRMRLSGTLNIGDNVRMRSGYSNYVGAHQPMAIWVCQGGTVSIGERCRISNTAIVCKDEISIFPETFIGGGCRIYDMDFHQITPRERLANEGPIPSAPIRIGPRAFVGGHVTVLKGVTIGEGAVIGAGSVVTRDVPPFEVWAGVPARHIRALNHPVAGKHAMQNVNLSGWGG